jgi:hypothetical protein
MTPRLRSALTYAAIVAVVFAAALVASFVYTHEPQRDTLSVSLRTTPAQASGERTVGGTLAAVDGGTLQLHTDTGDVSVTLPAGVPLLDLTRVPSADAPFATGAAVNVGGEETPSGLVISGIVAVEGATP